MSSDLKAGRATGHMWVMTVVSPLRATGCGYDGGRVAWKWHAIKADPVDSFTQHRSTAAACGMRARYGWTMDLFADEEDRCTRCEKALGLAPSRRNQARARAATKIRVSA